MGIPEGETRRIDRFYVYGITAAASVFAYFWLLVILKFSTEVMGFTIKNLDHFLCKKPQGVKLK